MTGAAAPATGSATTVRPAPTLVIGLLLALAVLAGAVALITGLDLAMPGRGGLTIAVALVAPGAALAVWARLGDAGLTVVTSVVVSLALVILVAQGMVLATWWRPTTAMTILLLVSSMSLLARAATVRARAIWSSRAQ